MDAKPAPRYEFGGRAGREGEETVLGRMNIRAFAKFLVSLALLTLTTFACDDSKPAADSACPSISPKQLPSGEAAGPAGETTGDYGRTTSWGSGDDEVVLLVGEGGPADDLGPGDGTSATVRGEKGLVVSVEDAMTAQTIITWLADDCRYTVWIHGTTNQGVDYAARI